MNKQLVARCYWEGATRRADGYDALILLRSRKLSPPIHTRMSRFTADVCLCVRGQLHGSETVGEAARDQMIASRMIEVGSVLRRDDEDGRDGV